MIASQGAKTQVLLETCVREKLLSLEACVHGLLSGATITVPDRPGRDVQTLPIRELPPKKGFASREGQARMLHDLASIELQAMELGLRTLTEFAEAPLGFREQLAAVTLDEGRHLALCLDALEELRFPWGSFPVHIGLWQATDSADSLLDRILIVHRYLEGAGLDASDTLLRRLDGVDALVAKRVVKVIRADEVGHVRFGNFWYRSVAETEGLDPERDFGPRLKRLFHKIPRRLEPISRGTRRAAGFTDVEIQVLEELRELWLGRGSGAIHQMDSSARK